MKDFHIVKLFRSGRFLIFTIAQIFRIPNDFFHSVFSPQTMPRKEFIQLVLLMFVFEQRLSFLMLQNPSWGLKVLKGLEGFHNRATVGVQGVMPLKNVGGQTICLK